MRNILKIFILANQENSSISRRFSVILRSPHYTFLVIGLIIGLLFVFLTPKFQVPDEITHYVRANQVAEGIFLPPTNQFGAGAVVKRELLLFIFPTEASLTGIHVTEVGHNKVFINLPIVYNPVQYFPQAGGILVSKIFQLSSTSSFYFGRLSNFFIWLTLTYIAIKITPIGKLFFLTVSLMPMTLFQAASNSPDAILFSLSALIVSLYIYLVGKNKMTSREAFYIILLSSGLAMLKAPYFLISYLFLTLPKNLYSKLKYKKLFVISIVLLPFIIALLWFVATRSLMNKESLVMANTLRQVSPTEQLTFVLHNPFEYLEIFAKSYIKNADFYLTSFVGTLGLLTVTLYNWIIILYISLLFLAIVIEEKSKNTLKVYQRLGSGIVLTSLLVIIPTILYLIWTPIGGKIIEGVQGRYFIPLAYILPIIFSGLIFEKTYIRRNNLYLLYYLLIIIMLLISINRVFLFYYS